MSANWADDVEHGVLALARAEERKHVDRAVERPLDVLVDQGLDVLEMPVVDRAMQRTRETPEAVLCHLGQS
ncbi:hypothetical protein ACVWZW_007126 [Bradyrhizobium sp. F1.13.4]